MTPSNNGFPAHWIDGTACNSDPDVQTWKLDDRTFIFRQSLCTNFEGPFVYLLIGDQKALLIDTGTGDADIATAVLQAVSAAGMNVPLVVGHSHSHGDHIGGDSQFAGKPGVTLVGTSVSAVYKFWGIAVGTDATFDLGNRTLDVMAIPGHQAAHIAIYDHRTQVLLTGDTLYPGRLYIDDWASYQSSVKRLADFAASHTISFVLGGHIELPKTGMDYPMGSTVHPDEHVLQLASSDVADLATTVAAMGGNPVKTYRTNFVVWP
jgi:glyoxylase-like metal-dependent hydrolase (beta-lactamase superfamily II)